jgi:hypothetical protein
MSINTRVCVCRPNKQMTMRQAAVAVMAGNTAAGNTVPVEREALRKKKKRKKKEKKKGVCVCV